MKSIYFDTLSQPMIILLFIVISLIIFILVIEPRISKRKLISKNEHGNSQFADLKEIKEKYLKEPINSIDKVGFPVWYDKNKNGFENVYFDNKSPHFLLIGSTGSGKSVTVSIPTSIHFATAKEKHSVVITDPKGELFKTTGKIFEENGFNVITIDFREPTKSAKVNIMQPIIDEWKQHCNYNKCMMLLLSYFLKMNKISLTKITNNKKYEEQIKNKYQLEAHIIDIIKNSKEELKNNTRSKKNNDTDILEQYIKSDVKQFIDNINNTELLNHIKETQNFSSKHQAETNRLIISLANLIFTEKESKDPFWINASKQLFIGIVGIFIEDYKNGLIDEDKINIASVKKFQNSSLIKENQTYLQRNLNTRNYGSLSKDYLTSILSSAENTYKSITAVFAEKMSIFDDLNVENITSISEFNFTSIGEKPTVLYIIVPDEDRAYFQLVTIILGMIIKDLTKFANLPRNNGTLPVKVEWILDEFANCPPLDSIETVVSVARSRGMRFYFFIQSFAQLDQVYGKETASIIQDNCALVYLKTNSIECAEVIVKKLGRETIITNSLSKDTDPFKIGANQTESLMGKELLNANEIIGLKYKTIIFPVFGNPIFRDTYMYSDIYPQYRDYPICNRKIKVLTRLSKNYYTVEKLRELYEKDDSNNTELLAKKMEQAYQKQSNSKMNKIMKDINECDNGINKLDLFSCELKKLLKGKVVGEHYNNGVYSYEVNSLFNKFELSKIKRIKSDDIILEIAENYNAKKTIVSIWQSLEREI